MHGNGLLWQQSIYQLQSEGAINTLQQQDYEVCLNWNTW